MAAVSGGQAQLGLELESRPARPPQAPRPPEHSWPRENPPQSGDHVERVVTKHMSRVVEFTPKVTELTQKTRQRKSPDASKACRAM